MTATPTRPQPGVPVYLARPIDQVRQMVLRPSEYSEQQVKQAHALISDAANLSEDLAEAGFIVYRPDEAWLHDPFGEPGAPAPSPAQEEVNRSALAACTVVVALLPSGIPTIGTILEIDAAARAGKHVVVVSDVPSAALTGLPGVIAVEHTSQALMTIEQWRSTGVLAEGVQPTEPIPLPFTVEGGGWALPRRFHADDAGLDLFVTKTTTIGYREFADVPSGCRVELPEGTWGLIVGRSSAIRQRRLLVVSGVIDVGWRGELFVGAFNASGRTQTVSEGERIGQLIVLPNLTEQYRPVKVDELGEHARGLSGFGSTGGYGGEATRWDGSSNHV